jgi:4-amino-4-deoxy-L-arabinose transferase
MFDYYANLFQMLPSSSGLILGLGLLLLFISIICTKKSYGKALFFLLISVLLIGIAFALISPYLHPWDEQFHALIAKSLTETPLTPRLLPEAPVDYFYENWNENHIWLHKPPLTFWNMAILFKFFGASVFTVRLASILLFTGTVLLVYKIGSIIKDIKTGYYAALIFGSLNYGYTLIAGLHTAEHVDIAFQFYITASCFSWLKYTVTRKRYWMLLMGFFSGTAILTKWLVGLLVYAGVGLTILSRQELRMSKKVWLDLALAFLVTLIVFLPWQIYTALTFPLEFWFETNFSSRHFHEVIEEHGGDILFYWDNLKLIYGVGFIGRILIVLSLLFSFRTIKNQYVLFILTTILTPFIFFSLASTKMDSFLIIVQPLVVILVVSFVLFIKEFLPDILEKIKFYIGTVVVFIIALLLLRPSQIQRDFLLDTPVNHSKLQERIKQHQYIQNYDFPKDKKIVLYNLDYLPAIHVSWMFYHNVTAYQRDFNDEEIKFLLENNYSLYTFVENSLQPIKKP